MRCLVMGVGSFESPGLGAPSRYLKHILLNSRKIFRTSEVEKFIQKMRKSQIKFQSFGMNFWKILRIFWIDSSNSEASKIFLELKSICLRYLEGVPRSGLSNAPTPMARWRMDQLKRHRILAIRAENIDKVDFLRHAGLVFFSEAF